MYLRFSGAQRGRTDEATTDVHQGHIDTVSAKTLVLSDIERRFTLGLGTCGDDDIRDWRRCFGEVITRDQKRERGDAAKLNGLTIVVYRW